MIGSYLKLPLSVINGLTLQGTNISPEKCTFEDDFPFPQVGYVNSLEGITPINWFPCGFVHPLKGGFMGHPYGGKFPARSQGRAATCGLRRVKLFWRVAIGGWVLKFGQAVDTFIHVYILYNKLSMLIYRHIHIYIYIY